MDTTIDSFFLLPPLRRRQPQSLLVGALTLALLFQTTHACSAYAPPRHLTGAASDIRSSFCLLTPELVEGPYYLHNKLIRSAISEGMPGIPFEFLVTVIDYATCEPLANVFVDIWHCDALGLYSGYAKGSLEQIGQPDRFNLGHETPTDNSTYMRGTMVTNADGVATFKSIMPGWYEGRVTHIHTKVGCPAPEWIVRTRFSCMVGIGSLLLSWVSRRPPASRTLRHLLQSLFCPSHWNLNCEIIVLIY
jgi:protocatechuate 3,4-dioxygenase beta subunit